MKLGLGEILETASRQKTKAEKIAILQKHETRPLLDIIQYALHPAITWDLPAGAPPFTATKFLDQENRLYQELRRMYLFVNGNGSRLRTSRLEELFIQILESVAPKDADLLLLVKERKLPKGLTTALVNEAFPGLIPDVEDQEVS